MPRYVREAPDAEVKLVSGTVRPCGIPRAAQAAERAAAIRRRKAREQAATDALEQAAIAEQAQDASDED